MSGVSNSFNQLCSANELASFRKAVASNNKESIEKHLSHMKSISEAELNAALFTCIENFRIEDQSDECLFLLLRYPSTHAGTRPTPIAKLVPFISCRWKDSPHRCLQNSTTYHGQTPCGERRQTRPLQFRRQTPSVVRA